MKARWLPLVAAAAFARLVAAAGSLPNPEPAWHFDEVFADGARICFLGDSITAGAQWSKVLSDFFYTRLPDRRFMFVNAGVGGDKAKESMLRLEEDVFSCKPDVVTVMFGMNDSNRNGGYVTNPTPRQVEMRNAALDDFRETLPKLSEALSKGAPNAKICWFTPTPYDEFARLDSPTRPGKADALEKCAEIVRCHASARGDWICELHAPMSEYNARERGEDPSFTTLCGSDRVHPEAQGGFFMAQAILRSWGAPSCVSDVTIDAASGKCTASENAAVSSVSVSERRVSFEVLEKSLPMPVAKDAKSVAAKTSFHEDLNREYLRVKNLGPGKWTLSIDGNVVTTASAAEWSEGVNIASLPTPQARQAEKVSALNARRVAAEKMVRRLAPARHFLRSHVSDIDDWEEVRRVVKSFEGRKGFPMQLLPSYLEEWPSKEKCLDEARRLADEIYAINKPTTHRYVLTLVGGAAVIRNIPYDSSIGKFGLGDLYLPEKLDAMTPLVLCIHGGGWRSGSRYSWSGVAEFFRDELGFAAFNIEYRLAPENRWPACGDDCVKAARFVLSENFKKRYGLSYDKIWICGGSAGGHLALWTLVNLPPESVAKTVSISAIGDPVPDFRLHHDRYSALLGEDVDEAVLAGINPITLVKPGMAPLLCTHTTNDSVVPIESHRAFADAYRADGNSCEFFEYGESAVPGIVGHRIWIPDSKPYKLIPEIEGSIRKFVKAEAASSEKPLKVLMIGNSFSICNLNQMPKVAAAMGRRVDLASLYIGGCSLERHWGNVVAASTNATFHPYRFDRIVDGNRIVDKGEANIPDALVLDKWDVVTIQQASHFSWRPETYEPFGGSLVAKIRELAPQAKMVVQETWSYPPWDKRLAKYGFDQAEMYRRLHGAYAAFAKKYGFDVIPVGTAAENAPDRNSLFTEPDFHFNRSGEYLQGLAFTAKLFGVDVRKCPYKPDWMDASRAEELKKAVMDALDGNN